MNAIVGPWVEAFVSTSKGFGFGDDVGPDGSLVCGTGGGGSMTECEGDFGATAGSGRAVKLSSADDVSIVIFFVDNGPFRMV